MPIVRMIFLTLQLSKKIIKLKHKLMRIMKDKILILIMMMIVNI